MTRRKFQELNLSNAYLFAATMEDEVTCKITLEMLLEVKIERVAVHVEHSLLYSQDYRSIRLDVYASDETGSMYNMEMQGENEGNLSKRSRYHQAEMDVLSLKPGEDFNSLGPNYVIFICCFDPFGKGLYRYTFTNKCVETGEELGDGTTKIFLSTKGRNAEAVPEVLVRFLRYLENSTDECAGEKDDAVSKIHSRVATIKRDRSWESRYMRVEELMQQQYRKGIEQGIEQGEKQARERLVQLMKCLQEAGEQDKLSMLADEGFLEQMYEKYNI